MIATKRNYRRRILLLVASLGFAIQPLVETSTATPVTQTVSPERVLQLAEDVSSWLIKNAVHAPNGIFWPDDVLNPDLVGYDLASGVAGKVVYFCAAYRATDNIEYLEMALGGADYLISIVENPDSFAGNSRRASLYTGISGVGVALLQVQQLTADKKYTRAVAQVVKQLEKWLVDDAAGVHWSDDFNDLIYGDAGTALFLATVARQNDNKKALELARRGAQYLMSQVQKTEQGSYWYFRRSKPFNLPNFSHGTAGIAYVLATVGDEIGDQALLDGARSGFEYLRSIAEIEDGLLRIPYGWGSESWQGLYEFGWAHGLAGTTSLFQQLQRAGIEVDSATRFEELARRTLLQIDLPKAPLAPFAEPSMALDKRFGRAGVLAVLSDWGPDVPTDEYAAVRDAIFLHIEGAAVRGEGMAHWQVDAPEFMGGDRTAYTGIFHGASGIGLATLRMHASMLKRRPYVSLPDEPSFWSD